MTDGGDRTRYMWIAVAALCFVLLFAMVIYAATKG